MQNHLDFCFKNLILNSNQGKFDQADKMDGKARKILSATKGLYPVNKNKVSKLSPEPAEILRAKNKSLRIP